MVEKALICAASSLAAGEPLIGNGTDDTDIWLLLEYTGRWGRKAFEDWAEAGAIKRHVDAFLSQNSGARFQFIRREGPKPTRRRLFVAHSGGLKPTCKTLLLDNYEQLCDVDFARDGEPVHDPLYLVCTHGKRDPCCAFHGLPLYRALAHIAPEHTWQTSHLGGHRFAPTLLALPFGMLYGRVPIDALAAMHTAHTGGQVADLALLRGRTAYSYPGQVAEAHLRRASGNMRLDAIELHRVEHLNDNAWRVVMSVGDAEHVVKVTRRLGEALLQGSCHKPKLSRGWHYSARTAPNRPV